MYEPASARNLPSLFDSLVQLLKPTIHLHTYIEWANAQPGPSLTMPLAYMLLSSRLFLNLSLETTVTAGLRIIAKHLPIIPPCHYILDVEPTFMTS